MSLEFEFVASTTNVLVAKIQWKKNFIKNSYEHLGFVIYDSCVTSSIIKQAISE